jgi:hypothetical protein
MWGQGGRGEGEDQMPTIHGGGERILSIAEMPKNAAVETGTAEQQMATYQRGGSTQIATHGQQHWTETVRYSGIQN